MNNSAAATLACIWEATAPKPGNVHPGADFGDCTYTDFVTSAVVCGPILGRAAEIGVGLTVLEAVRATCAAVSTNTNLGTLLLIAPLAAVSNGVHIANGIQSVLDGLIPDDTKRVYEAIRISSASGLGDAGEADVAAEPPAGLTLVDAMRLAADRDLVAAQYVNSFADVLTIAGWIETAVRKGLLLSDAIVDAHIRQIATAGDSLIARKCGTEVSDAARQRAADVISAGSFGSSTRREATAAFNVWLRADGNRRNPGTTADLIAAALFVLLREERLNWTKW